MQSELEYQRARSSAEAVQTRQGEPAQLTLNAPWGVGVLLGIRDWVCQPTFYQPGSVVEVVQELSAGDMEGACGALAREAREKRLPAPLEMAPWPLFYRPGNLGRVRVIECTPLRPPMQGYMVKVASPEPAWQATEAVA